MKVATKAPYRILTQVLRKFYKQTNWFYLFFRQTKQWAFYILYFPYAVLTVKAVIMGF